MASFTSLIRIIRIFSQITRGAVTRLLFLLVQEVYRPLELVAAGDS
jgi:hypothetical protein